MSTPVIKQLLTKDSVNYITDDKKDIILSGITKELGFDTPKKNNVTKSNEKISFPLITKILAVAAVLIAVIIGMDFFISNQGEHIEFPEVPLAAPVFSLSPRLRPDATPTPEATPTPSPRRTPPSSSPTNPPDRGENPDNIVPAESIPMADILMPE